MDGDRDRALRDITDAIVESYAHGGELAHVAGGSLPSREVIWSVVEDLLRLLFPGFLEPPGPAPEEVGVHTLMRVCAVDERLRGEIEKGLRTRQQCEPEECRRRAAAVTLELLATIPAIRELLAADIEAAYDGDPAAQSREEIILAYPGLQAIAVHRLAHVLWNAGIPIVPRVMSEYAHSRTGIDIHPGATIGKRFFIDHGTGVVIGETCVIGDNVKIYQGVTLGARSFPMDERGRAIKGAKRHPDIESGVTVYSGATILGPVVIGHDSIIGGNVWLTQSVPPDTRIVVRTPQQIHMDEAASDWQI